MESETRPRGWFIYVPEGFKFLVEDLTEVHCHRLVDLLPQMGTEDLDKRDLQCRNFTVKEDTRQIKLHLETDVDVGSVDSWGPPERETSVGNLIETGTLGVRELLEFHALFETGCLFSS